MNDDTGVVEDGLPVGEDEGLSEYGGALGAEDTATEDPVTEDEAAFLVEAEASPE